MSLPPSAMIRRLRQRERHLHRRLLRWDGRRFDGASGDRAATILSICRAIDLRIGSVISHRRSLEHQIHPPPPGPSYQLVPSFR